MSNPSSFTDKIKETKHSLKMISVLLALFLWFFVLKSQSVSLKENLEISYLLPSGYSLAEVPVDEIRVHLEGKRVNLRRSDIRKSKVKINIPADRKEKFTYRAELNVKDLPQPSGVVIKEFYPKNINLVLEKTMKRKVKVSPTFAGELGDNTSLNSFKISPSEILISGARGLVEDINYLKTKSINLGNIELDEKDIEIDLEIPPLIRIEELVASKVQVSLDIGSSNLVTQEIVVPIKYIYSGELIAKPRVTEVMVSVSYILDRIDENRDLSKIDVYADLTNVDYKKKNSYRLIVEKPKNIKIIKIEPEYISVEK